MGARKLFITVIVFVFASSLAWADQQPEKKAYQVDTRLPVISWREYINDCPFYFLEENKEIVLNEDWSVNETHHYRIKIQKDSARYLGEQKIYYNQSREEILDIQAHVETPDGQMHPFTKIQDLDVFQDSPMYSDLKVKVVTLPHVNVGSIIDVEISSRMQHEIIPHHFSRQEFYPYEPHSIYRAKYVLPRNMNIRFKEHSPSVKAIRQAEGEKDVYIFEHRRTMKEVEQHLPPYNEIYGVSSFSSMSDWGTIADWYRALVKKNTVPDPMIIEKSHQLTDGLPTEKEKARAILEFLQDKFRYVSMSFGDNAVEPHPTEEIFKNRYGDCKDWSVLAKQMLNVTGIRANIVIFQDEFEGDPRWSLPSLALFDHVILEAYLDGEQYFVDPQLKYFDFGQYPAGYNNAYLFVIEEKGFRFDTIPVEPEEELLNTIRVKAAVNSSGGADYLVQASLGPELSRAMKMLWDVYSGSGKDMFFEDLETRFARGGQITKKKMQGFSQRYGTVKMNIKVENVRSYQKTRDLIIIHEPLSQYFPNPFVDKDRHYPVFIPMGSYYKIFFTYLIPSGWEVETVPPDINLSNPLLKLKRAMKVKEGKLYALYVFQVKRGRWPALKYPQLQNIFQRFYEKESEPIVLRRKDGR